MSRAAVAVEELSKRFRMYANRNQSLKGALLNRGRSSYNEFWALRDVSLEVPDGCTFGLIGENGSGKSTLLKCMARILEPDAGSVRTVGKLAALLELGSGFHPELSGRENIYLNGSILGLSKGQLDRRFDEIVDFSGIEAFIDEPVKNYSSGMYVRLGFAVAINVDPDILLVDEVLAVGDAAFQRKCEQRFAEFRRAGRTVIIVSHAMGTMRDMCEQVAWMDHGRLLAVGSPHELVEKYVDESLESRTDVDSGESRTGTGEVVVDGVELLDREGTVIKAPGTGDTITLRLHFTARQPVDEPVFSFAVESIDGPRLWAHNSRDAGVVPPHLPAGTGYVDLDLPGLHLQPGVYDLSASVLSHDYTTTHVFDRRLRLHRFSVLHGRVRESGGPLSLGGAWQLPVRAERPAAADPAAASDNEEFRRP